MSEASSLSDLRTKYDELSASRRELAKEAQEIREAIHDQERNYERVKVLINSLDRDCHSISRAIMLLEVNGK